MPTSSGFLNHNFLEVATVLTVANDFKGAVEDTALRSAAAIVSFFSQDKTLYTREQMFEYDKCDVDDQLRDMIVTQDKRFREVSKLYEMLETNPTPALVNEFQKITNDGEFREIMDASIPNDVRLEFEDEGYRTMQVRIVSQVPFSKTREMILARLEDVSKQPHQQIRSVAISAHMRYLPPSAKQLGSHFKRTLLGLH